MTDRLFLAYSLDVQCSNCKLKQTIDSPTPITEWMCASCEYTQQVEHEDIIESRLQKELAELKPQFMRHEWYVARPIIESLVRRLLKEK